MKTKTFTMGGIHPADNKLSADKPIEELEIPIEVQIPIAQHIGAPAKPVVKKGDKVKVGTLIAEAGGFISANIHSSVSGTVGIAKEIVGTSGYLEKVVSIKVEGDEWEESIIKSDELKKEITLSPDEIQAKVKEAGIVGLGGATFPSHVKFAIPEGCKAEMVLINGVECEPYLTADHRLMLEKGEEILVGTSIAMKALGVDKGVIGIEENKPDAIKHLTKLAENYSGILIQPLKVQYPQGGEKQLIKSITGKEVTAGALPIHYGLAVFNVGTIFAVYEAVQKNKPLIDRIVTVTGKNVSKPSNYKVRIGTPLKELIEKAGGVPENTAKIVSGGPMMGKALTSTEIPATKGTSGVLLFSEKDTKRADETACIRCGKCSTVCCLGLQPFLFAALVRKRNWEKLEEAHVMDCLECGSCSYTCPANLPLVDLIKLGKIEIKKLREARKK